MKLREETVFSKWCTWTKRTRACLIDHTVEPKGIITFTKMFLKICKKIHFSSVLNWCVPNSVMNKNLNINYPCYNKTLRKSGVQVCNR